MKNDRKGYWIQFQLPQEMHAALKDAAEEDMRPIGALVRIIIRDWLREQASTNKQAPKS